MFVCTLHHKKTESVLNGISFDFIIMLLGSLISHVTYFVK